MSSTESREALTIAATNLGSALRRWKQTRNGRPRVASRVVRKGATLYSVRRIVESGNR